MGEFMSAGGISEKIVNLANLAVGRFRGGLAYVNVLDSMFFGGISGSAVADVSSLGTIVIPMMVRQGYDEDFAVGLTVTTACQGVLIPPSHNMVIYAMTAGGVSVGKLFLAGYVPGVLLGLAGGYFGGKTDSAVNWLCATVASMPGLLFILAIALVLGKGMAGLVVGIGLTTWVGTCRTIRAETLKHRDRAYVQAAKTLGYSPLRIMFRHILPNVAHVILIQFAIRFPSAVSTEVFISFLGIGVQGEPSWGIMINNARTRLWQGVWWEMTFTTLAIFLLVLVFNHLADTLRDHFDPALRT